MNNNSPGNDRRRFPRVRGPFEAMVDDRFGHRPARVIDVTEAGCYINEPTAVEPNERVRLTLHLPHAGHITVQSRVVYVETGLGFGAEFIDVPPGTRQELTRVVNAMAG